MGTRKGRPNRNKKFLLNRLQDMYGEDFNPVLRMAEQADRLHKIAEMAGDVPSIKASIDAWDKIAVYVEPKLKSVEIKSENLGHERAPTVIEIIPRIS